MCYTNSDCYTEPIVARSTEAPRSQISARPKWSEDTILQTLKAERKGSRADKLADSAGDANGDSTDETAEGALEEVGSDVDFGDLDVDPEAVRRAFDPANS